MSRDAASIAQQFATLSVPARRSFLAKLRANKLSFSELPIVPAARDTPLPLSFAQQGLWLTWQMDPTSIAYNISGLLRFTGPLNVDALRACLTELTGRHSILRTVFRQQDSGNSIQTVLPLTDVSLPLTDWRHANNSAAEADIQQWAASLAYAPFRLDSEAPLRAALLHTNAERILLLAVHHIAADGRSLRILIDELIALYEARAHGHNSKLAPVPVQFADYAVWQRTWLEAGEMDRQLAYWKARLGSEHPLLALPFDRARCADRAPLAARHELTLPVALSSRLRALARASNASLYMTMLAVLALVLHRFSGSDEVRVGVPSDHRDRPETQRLIGHLVNLLVLRTQLDPARGFQFLLESVRATLLDAQEHKDLPFDELVHALRPERHAGAHPLFQVKCTEWPELPASYSFAGLAMRIEELASEQAHFDLSFDFTERLDGIWSVFTYNAHLFDARMIERMGSAFAALAEQVIRAPQSPLHSLDLPKPLALAAGEARRWHEVDVMQLWSKGVNRVPQGVALRSEDVVFDYLQLDRQSSYFAKRLIAQGVGVETRVGIYADRSVEFVVGVLAVLKAGGAYVPLDPALPGARLAHQTRDSGASVLLSASPPAFSADIPVIPLILDALATDSEQPLHSNWPPVHASQSAYVIYTSGSTGQPKGVAVTRGGLSNYVHAVLDRLSLPASVNNLAMVSTVAADLGHTVMFGALCSGRTLHLIRPERAFDPDRFADYLREHSVDVLKIVPSHLQALLSASNPADALPRHTLILGGEATSWALLERLQDLKPDCRVINHYGPTETTVGVLTQDAAASLRSAGALPMGRPLHNTQIYVLNAHLSLMPPGVTGELYLGGVGLASGYINQGGLTAQRFIASPFAAGERLYRTGDRVKLLADGSLEFLGRTDDQVKIRGYRVELREIVSALKAQPGVQAAEVIVRSDEQGRSQLHGYVVPEIDSTIDVDSLRRRLENLLPDYMVPDAFVMMERFPLTANGKVARALLPEPQAERQSARHEAPQGDIETVLAEIWSELLNVERVGRHDNLFELGGDSILALQIVARARKRGVAISAKALMERQTIAAVAAIAQRLVTSSRPPEEIYSSEEFELTPIQRGLFEHHGAHDHWNQSVLLEPLGTIDADVLRRAVQRLIAHHASLRLSFHEISPGQWRQRYEPAAPASCFEVTDLSNEQDPSAAITQAANRIQRSVSLQSPFKALWMDLGAKKPGRLLLVAHHLVIDVVSWQVLLEDLQSLYLQLRDTGAAALETGTLSLKRWSEILQDHSRSAALGQELPYWNALSGNAESDLPSHNPDGSNTFGDLASVCTELDETRTGQLLIEAPKAYRTQINDLLLTALARALCDWTARDSVLIELEGHGREAVSAEVDLSRSVGWFTALYPVRLTPCAGLGASIKAIKEQLRKVPNNGIGYGVLRYLGSALARAAYPRITFNYLGQLDLAFGSTPLWRMAQESTGADRPLAARRRCWFDVGVRVYQKRLVVSWSYSRVLHSNAEVQRLADLFQTHLDALIAHCASGAQGVTPSDFPLAGLSQEQLDALPVPVAQIDDLYPMTPLQRGMMFHALHAPDEIAYLAQLRVDIDGLDVPRFRAAWEAVLDRHDVLRSGFLHPGDLPLQWVPKTVELPFIAEHLCGTESLSDVLDRRARTELTTGFDFLKPPLLRLMLLHTSERRHHFIFTWHHLLTDGWSTAQLISEVLEHYKQQKLPPLSGRYRDYISWLQRRDPDASNRYWKRQVQRIDEPTRLSGVLPGTASAAGYFEHIDAIDRNLSQRLETLAECERVTVNTLIQAVWALLLMRYTGQSPVVFGATSSGRPPELAGIEQLLGQFVNSFPIIVADDPGIRVGDWLRALHAQNLDSREHEHTPLYEIQRWAGAGGQELFDTLLSFQNYPIDQALRERASGPLSFSGVQVQGQTHYALTLVVEHGETLTLRYSSPRALLAESAVASIAAHVHQLLEELTVSAERPVGAIELLGRSERELLSEWRSREWQGAAAKTGATDEPAFADEPAPADEPIHRPIERQARVRPNAIALICGDERLSFAGMNARANQLARRLIALGIAPEVKVGIALERSIAMVVGVLAVLKAGGAYVPLDGRYPVERLRYVMQDSGIQLLLTQRAVLEQLPLADRCAVLCIDDLDASCESDADPEVPVQPSALAYVIYTSGSTGEPKGAQLSHHNITRLLRATEEWFHFSDRDVWTLFHSCAFDFSVWEIFGALCYGGTVVVVPHDVCRSPEEFLELLTRHRVTVLNQTPSAFKQLMRVPGLYERAALDLRAVIFGGEALDPQSLRPWMEHFGDARPRLINMYGITETTVHVTYRPITNQDLEASASPIGESLPDLGLRVLDSQLGLTPVGIPGELYVAGEGLARGYLNRPGLTAGRFIADPYSRTGERLYRSGDRVRWNAQGELEYLGRVDHQVKIRGYRIELGEIESQLLAQPEVREAVVLAREEGAEKHLVGYVVASAQAAFDDVQLIERSSLTLQAAGSLQPKELPAHRRSLAGDPSRALQLQQLGARLRERLLTQLPEYMVPAQWVVLEALPLNANGKVDRKALPAPELANLEQYEAPQGAMEQTLAKLWSEVLGVQPIGRHDSFFALGGHSLLATQLVSRIRRDFECDLPLRKLFALPVLADMSRWLASQTVHADRDPSQLIERLKTTHGVLSSAQQRLWFLWKFAPRSCAFNMSQALRLQGQLRVEVLHRALVTLMQRHEVLRTLLREVEGVPNQVIVEMPLPYSFADDVPGIDAALDLVRADASTPFDLESGPLWRAALLRLAADDHVLMVTIHHIVADGWSLKILMEELSELYCAQVEGLEPVLTDALVRYLDYSAWQQRWLQCDEAQRQRDFWRNQLAGRTPMFELPRDLPVRDSRSHRAAVHTNVLDSESARRLNELSQSHGVTPYMFLLAASCVVMSLRSGLSSFLIGTDIANRNRVETEHLVGFFVNQMVVKVDCAAAVHWTDLLMQVRETLLAAGEHQDLPFERVVDLLRVKGRSARAPLFEVKVLYRPEGKPVSLPGISVSDCSCGAPEAELDLIITFVTTGGKLQTVIKYDAEVYSADAIQSLELQMSAVLRACLGDPATPMVQLAAVAAAVGSRHKSAKLQDRALKLAQLRTELKRREQREERPA